MNSRLWQRWAAGLLCLLSASGVLGQVEGRSYRFDGSITSAVLENYLSRAVQCAGSFVEAAGDVSPYPEDDLRMLANTGAKFVGRAAIAWTLLEDEEEHFLKAARAAERAHRQDPELILQACVFEIVHTSRTTERKQTGSGVDAVPVPAWVFEEFALPVENRTFRYDAMLFPHGRSRDFWGPGASPPDITRLETQLWYYYRARRYIDAGYEAIHFGQSTFVGDNDRDHRAWESLLQRVRRYAAANARRHYVLCDSHLVVGHPATPMKVGDRLLWDFASFPLRLEATTEPLKARLRVGYRDSMYQKVPGGLHPAGWRCEVLPQLYEFDNCAYGLTTQTEATVWGADEATWFANLRGEERNRTLWELQEWIWSNAPHGYMIMPGRRPARVPAGTPSPRTNTYIVNTRSPSCPAGFGQEETVKAIWSSPRYADNSARSTVPPKLDVRPVEFQPRTLDELRELYTKYGIRESEL